jgi:PTH1 family peptidyl-tRNA hydrolase
MRYIIGLGNPGEEYASTRHNTGRIILELLAKKNFTEWKKDMKLHARVAKGDLDGEKMTFVCPETFMNNSGTSVKPLVASKKDLGKLVVVYDDLDLPLGRIKLSFNRSAGGHNGLGSIIKAVKSEEFIRIRVGVSPSTPSGKIKKPSGEDAVQKFLLGNFKEKELLELKKISKTVKEILVCISAESKDKAMSLYNQN